MIRMSNELEHARKARILKGSRLDELFDPSLRSPIDPILRAEVVGNLYVPNPFLYHAIVFAHKTEVESFEKIISY